MTASMLPASAYLDDEVLAWERTHLFAGAWVCAGRSNELAGVGARRAVAVGDDSVLLVRGDDGVVRGFYNVCRHRAHELAPCGSSGEGRAIQCPYHGWRYDLGGALVSTPRYEPPLGFVPTDHGLVPVPVEDWHGWIMVNAGGDAAAVDTHLAGIEHHIGPYEPERLVVGARHTYELACNWKLIVENYQECLHCRHIHPELCAVSPPNSGRNHDGHVGAWVGGWLELMPNAATMSLDGTSPITPLSWLPEGRLHRVEYLAVLPNLLVSLHPDYVLTHRLEPLAPHRTAVECQWLFAPEAASAAGFDPAYAVDFWDLTNRQDWAACEAVQRGVSSRGYRQGPFAAREDGVAQFVELVADAYLHGGWRRSATVPD